MRSLFLILACSVIAADDPRPKTLEELDLDRMQGAWTRVSTESNGHKRLLENPRPTLLVAADTFQFGANLDHERVVLDAKPLIKAIDLIPTGDSSGPLKGKAYPGIYKIEGDKLTLCLSIKPGSDRPTGFETADNNWIVDVYERAKPGAPKAAK